MKNLETLHINNWRILRIRNAKFAGHFFIRTQTYREIFKSALVYL